ncbi:MAG: ATP phosphoribosyltransferase regulatory subunit [Campylobacteraceae bacterium]|nr:ATP phosphoribosyltransferase regulatory subunit [Campylobacteraceae bacterium]
MDNTRADLDHEIPNGSRLYFSKSASLKRELESFSAAVFQKNGFEEIITPHFSYHQHLSVASDTILSFKDSTNHDISLRADSTVDVVRIVLRRLKNDDLKRVFYIQPVFKYPNSEFYQIGAEFIGERNLSLAIEITDTILSEFKIDSFLQISNIEIPKQICKILNIPIQIFEKGDISQFLSSDVKWLRELARINSAGDIENIKKLVPSELIKPLESMESLASGHKNAKFAPLYYSRMRYYDDLFFRFISGNSVLCSGGDYEIDGLESSGFALMSDAVIEKILEKKD